MKWGDRNVETPVADEHDNHQTDLHFDPNVLATQLGGVSNSFRRKKNSSTHLKLEWLNSLPLHITPPNSQKVDDNLKRHL